MIDRLLLCLLCFAAPFLAPAQQQADPGVDFPSGDQAWTVAFEAPEGKSAAVPKGPPAAVERAVDIVRQGNVRRDRITWGDGHVTEQWWVVAPSFLLFENGPGRAVSWTKGAWARGQSYDETLFPWVGASTFVEPVVWKGKRSRLYRTRIPSGTGTVTCEAWIDEETRRPLAYGEGGPVALFTFSGASAEPLAMPERFQAAAQKMRDLDTAPKRFGQ